MHDSSSDGVRTIIVEREPLNTLDLQAIETLSGLFAAHPVGTALVLSGAGGAFSAGVDSKAFLGYDRQTRVALARAITGMTAHLLSIEAPVVAAIGGHALGGGLVLALCCDYRLATQDPGAKFGLFEARAGIPFPSGPAEIVRQDLPSGLLRQLTLACRTVPGDSLVEQAVFDELCAPDALLATAEARARELARLPGFAAVKAQMRGPLARTVRALADAGREPDFEQL